MKLSIATFTRANQDRLAKFLTPLQELADELVVLIDSEAEDSFTTAQKFTNQVHVIPHEGYIEAHLQDLVSYCSGDWIFRIDDDETLSPGWTRTFIEELISDKHTTHYWIPRRWLVSRFRYSIHQHCSLVSRLPNETFPKYPIINSTSKQDSLTNSGCWRLSVFNRCLSKSLGLSLE